MTSKRFARMLVALVVVLPLAGCPSMLPDGFRRALGSTLEAIISPDYPVDQVVQKASILEPAQIVGELCQAPASVNGRPFTLQWAATSVAKFAEQGVAMTLSAACEVIKTGTWLKITGVPNGGDSLLASLITTQKDGGRTE